MPSALVRLAAIWTVAVPVFVSIASGCLASPGDDHPEAQTSEAAWNDAFSTWDFTGLDGSLVATVPDLSWFHIMYPHGAHPYDVRVRVTWRYDPTWYPYGFSGGVLWSAEYGTITPARILEVQANDFLAATDATVGAWTPIGDLLVPVDPLVQETFFTVGEVVSALPGSWGPSMASIHVTRKIDHTPVQGTRPVRHFAFVNLGPIPTAGPVEVSAEWENAPVAIVWGGAEDRFAFHREDFDGVGAGVKSATLQGHATQETRLATPLVEDAPTVYWFWPRACIGSCDVMPHGEGTITAPDGEQRSGSLVAGPTDQDGMWTFDVPMHAKLEWEAPVLFGVRHAFPLFPWPVENETVLEKADAATIASPTGNATQAAEPRVAKETPEEVSEMAGASAVSTAVLSMIGAWVLARRRL